MLDTPDDGKLADESYVGTARRAHLLLGLTETRSAACNNMTTVVAPFQVAVSSATSTVANGDLTTAANCSWVLPECGPVKTLALSDCSRLHRLYLVPLNNSQLVSQDMAPSHTFMPKCPSMSLICPS